MNSQSRYRSGMGPRSGRQVRDCATGAGAAIRAVRTFVAAGVIGAVALLGGCVVYEPVPAGYTRPASFDRSFNAAAAAMREQGVAITQEDRGAGVVRGTRGGINVTGTVRSQADGSVRVQFDTSGATASDPTLLDRITRSYNAYMGR